MATRAAAPAERPTARERLLAAANELFYEEGVHTVGIDKVIERAGVAKATLYSAYGSKDELIRAYLRGRQAVRRSRLTEAVSRHDVPREQLLSVFDALGEVFAEPDYRGCAFANASAEARRDSPINEVTDEVRAWIRKLFTDLATAAGAAEPAQLAQQLVVLYDGASLTARMDRNPAAAATARTIAALLIDAATG
ncbi:TetR/AcrR family transcriptional regulator [Streptacidiphilus sp. PAMC 29251]